MKTALPDWVKPGAIAFDRSTNSCFSICWVKRLKGSGDILLMHQPKENGDAYAGHSLSDCKLAEPGDLANCRTYFFNGLAVILSFKGDRIVLHNPHHGQAIVRLPQEDVELSQAARSFASFFNGTVLPPGTPLPGEVSHAA